MSEDVIVEADGSEVDLSANKSLRAETSRRKAQEAMVEEDLLHIVSTQQGKRAIWRLLDSARPFASPIRATTEMTYHELGRQEWGREVVAKFQRSPRLRRAWQQMQNEAEDNGW